MSKHNIQNKIHHLMILNQVTMHQSKQIKKKTQLINNKENINIFVSLQVVPHT